MWPSGALFWNIVMKYTEVHRFKKLHINIIQHNERGCDCSLAADGSHNNIVADSWRACVMKEGPAGILTETLKRY